MALMSDYAFSKLKLKRIDCAFTLVQKSWQQRTELLGYRHFFEANLELKHILLFGTIIFILWQI